MDNPGLALTAIVGLVYGLSFALVPERVQRAPWWRVYVIVGALLCLALFVVFVVIPFLT